ncbi:NF-kappa-B inhibitor zeta isoform X2 [Pseudoliparis swirei]|uniref:NF-kappa-B inhibitor zeta isoform X2 n=1 Tax=Pseudoliparis swirei TaxID=2059687 RepID=UPI0024BED9F4|nr:NF-kappa-B inhibitor zeta isoform X2 [Pseudoliparis swirei]
MGGRGEPKEPVPAHSGAEGHAPVPDDTGPEVAAGPTESGGSVYGVGEKVYLGVRVKMPVRDLLKKIRTDQGLEPHDFQRIYGKKVKGNGKKVKMRAARRTCMRKRSTKSLEELSIIVEVLEEDLRMGNTCRSPPQSLPSPNPPVSPGWSPTGSGYNSDESDNYATCSEYQPPLRPPGFMDAGPPRPLSGGAERDDAWNQNDSAFFWTQLQREESQLADVHDAELLAPDELGKTALHQVACIGKRALGYAIARRMAAANRLDLKDSDGMTPLLHAAKHNHHLMVADLILLGADINEVNHSGKTCLHLSAEKGYTRVLEVLKNAMLDGVYVDVEATDNSGEPEYAAEHRLTPPPPGRASWRPDSNVLSWFRLDWGEGHRGPYGMLPPPARVLTHLSEASGVCCVGTNTRVANGSFV